MKCRISRAAAIELRHVARHYNEKRAGLGKDFRAAVAHSLDGIEQFPHASVLLKDNIRLCMLKRFPYGIVYRVKVDEIEVLSLVHLHSDPEAWTRLRD